MAPMALMALMALAGHVLASMHVCALLLRNLASLDHPRLTCSMPPPSFSGAAPNRPKNHLITDATKPFTFRLLKYGREKRVTVDQTAEEATWRE